MGWIKIPVENHPLFLAALPKDPRISTLKMFGGIAATSKGNMFAGLFARSVMVKLSADNQKEALTLDGSEPFDPMGNTRVMKDTVLLGEGVMDEPNELRSWLRHAFEYSLTLPAKKPRAARKPAARTPVTTKLTSKKPTKPAAKQPAKQKR